MTRHVNRHHSTPLNRIKSVVNAGKAGWKVGKNLASTFKRLRGNSTKGIPAAKKQKTGHKKKTVSPTIQSPVEGLSKSFSMGPKGHLRVSSSQHPTSYYDTFVVNSIGSGTQTQGIADIFTAGSTQVMATCANMHTQLDAGINTRIADAVTLGFEGYEIYVKELYLEVTFTNQTQCVADISLWDLVSKEDSILALSPSTIFSSAPNTVSGSSGISGTWPFAYPLHYKSFTDRFSLVKRTPIELSPGRSHKHIFRFPVMRKFSADHLNTFACVKGLTCWTMITFKGMPLDSTLSLAGTTDVSLCQIKLVYAARAVSYVSLLTAIPRFEKQGTNQFVLAPTHLYNVTCDTVVDEQVASVAAGGGPF